MQYNVSSVTDNRIAFNCNCRVRISIDNGVFRGDTSFNVRCEHYTVLICCGVTVHGNRTVVQSSRIGAGNLDTVLIPLVAAALGGSDRGVQRNFTTGADDRSVQSNFDIRSSNHIHGVVAGHGAFGGRLHDIHLVNARRSRRVHRECAVRGSRYRAPGVCACELGPSVHYVRCVVVAKVRCERHLAAGAQRVNRRGHFHQNRVVHVHIVRLARHSASRAGHLCGDCVYVCLVRSVSGNHDQGVVRRQNIGGTG